MSSDNKAIAEKILMFTNLLFHIDDYIKNKKERKGQLNVSKNIRLVLREVISSKVNLKFFINNEIISTDEIPKKSLEEKKKEKEYIKKINPLSFNQKNLININLFYNTNNEIFIINYLILEKIFSILRSCIWETIKKKNGEYEIALGRKDKNFVLNNLIFDELANDDATNEENILRKMLKKQFFIEKSIHEKNKFQLSKININNLKYNSIKSHSIDVSNAINNNYLINNITNNITKVENKKDENNRTNGNYLKNQIRRINEVKVPLTKTVTTKTIRSLNNSSSLPLIYDKQILNYKMNSYYNKVKRRFLSKIKIKGSQKIINEKNKYLIEKIFDNKILPKYINPSSRKYYIKSRNVIFRK